MRQPNRPHGGCLRPLRRSGWDRQPFLRKLRRALEPRRNHLHQCGVAFPVPVPAGMQKSKIAAGILGILLGGLGIHNFYLGYTGKAVAQLLISILSIGFLSFVSAIWGLVEGIMILTGSIAVDGKGVPLKD